jgi:5-methylcytosine-specific restriction endonuclease McrA
MNACWKINDVSILRSMRKKKDTPEERKKKKIAEYDRKKRLKNLEASRLREREQKQKWRDDNPERSRANNAAWRKKNLEKARAQSRAGNARWRKTEQGKRYLSAYQKAYRAAHREKLLAYAREWRAANRDKTRAYTQKCDHKNREIRRIKAQRRREVAPEAVKQAELKWRSANREKVQNKQRQRRARMRGAAGTHNAAAVEARMALFGNCCAYCGGEFQTVDHVIPLSRGGTCWPANLRPACRRCNSKKNDSDWRKWKVRL